MSSMTKKEFQKLGDEQKAEAFLAALRRVNRLSDLFGDDADNAKNRWKKLAKVVHPDLLAGDDVAAKEASQLLNELWAKADEQIENGVYGELTVPGLSNDFITVDNVEYHIGRKLGTGDIADVYLGADPNGQSVVIKVARDRGDNDLMDNEVQVLESIKDADGFDKMDHYFPQVIGSGKDSSRCRINVLSYNPNMISTPEELESLKNVVQSFGDAFSVRHIGWIWRKLITGLAFAHRNGIIHAALTPDNILLTIDNEKHGVVLAGWIFGSEKQNKVVGMSEDWVMLYPPNMGQTEAVQPTPELDVYMAAKSMLWCVKDMPVELQKYFNWCAQDSLAARPSSFKTLLDQFEEIIFYKLGWQREFIRLNYNGGQSLVEIDWNWF